MWPYWLLFAMPLIGVLRPFRLDTQAQRLAWGGIWLFFALMIGLRHEVGGDWFTYLRHHQVMAVSSLEMVFGRGDPGYYLLNWLAARLGLGIYGANLMCGAILMAGVVRFCRRQPLPWLALLVAVPYLVIVVGMGYSRQAVALGFAFLGLVALADGRTRNFVLWVLVGAAFHKSAVLLLPIAGLAASRNRWMSMAMAAIVTLIGAYLFLLDSVDRLWTHYVEADYHSQGGLIRVMMNAVPAALFIGLHRYLHLGENERRLWWLLSLLALACIPLVLISSTATDRVALYLIPLQLFVFARLHLITGDRQVRGSIVAAVVAYYAIVQFVWLTFANHAFAWLPYQLPWVSG